MEKEETQQEKALAKHLNKYIKDKHNQDECIGFIDGFKECYKLILDLEKENKELKKMLKFHHESRETIELKIGWTYDHYLKTETEQLLNHNRNKN